jgi:hypothetical protein
VTFHHLPSGFTRVKSGRRPSNGASLEGTSERVLISVRLRNHMVRERQNSFAGTTLLGSSARGQRYPQRHSHSADQLLGAVLPHQVSRLAGQQLLLVDAPLLACDERTVGQRRRRDHHLGQTRRSASIACDQNTTGSLSPSSIVSHATAVGSRTEDTGRH